MSTFSHNFPKWFKSTPQWRGADLMQDNIWLPAAVTVAYLVMLFGGSRLMRGREGAKLKWTLTFWNASTSSPLPVLSPLSSLLVRVDLFLGVATIPHSLLGLV